MVLSYEFYNVMWRKHILAEKVGARTQASAIKVLNFIALSLLEYDAIEHNADGCGACVVCELPTLHIGLDRVCRRCFQAKF